MLIFNKLINAEGGAKRYLTNVSWQLLERVFRVFVNFFVMVWLIRHLGPSDFGIYSYVISFVILFATMAKFGLNNILVKKIVEGGVDPGALVNSAFTLKFFGSLLIFLLMLIVLQLFEHEESVNLYIAIIGMGFIFQSLDVVEYYHQAIVNMKPIVIAKLAQSIFSSVLKVVLIRFNMDLEWFFWTALLDIFFLSIFYLVIFYRMDVNSIRFNFDKLHLKSYWFSAWPIALSNMAMIAYVKMDQIMLFSLINKEAVGIYAAATRVSEAWYFIPMIITATLFPSILNIKKKNIATYNDRFSALFRLMILMGIIIALPLSFFSDKVILLLYGVEYMESSKILIIHAWVGLFIALGMSASRWFIAENLQKLFLIRALTGLVINIILNLMLIPLYGVIGAAVATLISVIFANVFSYSFNKKLRPLFLMTVNSFNPFWAKTK